MKSFVTLLTAAAVLLHVSLGCCAHHAHTHSVVSQSSPEKTGCCRHHRGDAHSHADADEQPENERPHHPPLSDCDESDCVFITSNAASFDAAAGVASIIIVDSLFVDFTAELTSYFRIYPAPSLLAPPLRAHLLHQVFLI